MGADTNPKNNDGEGTKGTDRSNIINLAPKRHSGTNPANKFGWPSNSYPQSVDAGTFMNLGKAFAVKAGLPGMLCLFIYLHLFLFLPPLAV